MITKVERWGNSLAIRIPNRIVKRFGLKAGDPVRVFAKGKFLRVEFPKQDK